ncbi:prolyl oligopeptidase family serine peptidase [Acidiferrimicrobium sp. IK]|uniref:prolyl oligopeptidase family serine peptidase n=1 Tax=Acidiferrimicrobium sp. IK TaxID=2871700 RepID=UPI0021CB6525|nr:prolyl oligopeptidase family serine peptidase [Acidiferrimicrobium sp. IK]MCU4183588.1 prolyl oligopeptidase family serine peptidase [Acidiferrimicrobium sp. IK]
MRYPDTRRQDIVDTLHGYQVADPYRWLEDAADPEVEAWSSAQDALTSAVLEPLAERGPLRARLRELVPDVTGPPVVAGGRWFWARREAAQDHAVLRVADSEGARRGGTDVRVLVDPNALSAEGTTTLDGWAPSLEGDRLAYLLSEGGDEESRLWIVDTATGERLDGPVDRVRYSPLAWLPGGDALLYVRRLAPGQVPAGEEAFHRRLWIHRVGTDPDQDVLLFGEGIDPTAYLGVTVSDDGRWAAVTASLGTAPRNELHVAELDEGRPVDGWTPVVVGVDAQTWPHFDRRGQLWLVTDLHAPRRKLCVTDPAAPAVSGWRDVIAEDPDGAVLEDYALVGEELVVVHSRHALSELAVHDRVTGIRRRPVALPGAGSADLTSRRDEAGPVWVAYTDYATPYQVLALDPLTGSLAPDTDGIGAAPGPGAATPAVHSRQLTCRSADGTEVRVTVVAPVDAPDQPRPAVLYGYGGFNVAMTPAYSSSILAWVQAGGVWAVANLRGGSEEGEGWHRAGMREHKTRVFEDFEAVADHLVAEGWTTNDQLGIMGGSNGGLLVGAALTRSPERYRAVVCSAPLLDMVRYERFGLGATWNDEYGRADDPTELGWLLSYSPYHHVRDGASYPAVLFTVFDGDTRVDPLHARKLAAALQHATSAAVEDRPVILRREADVGHGARGVARAVSLSADQLAFLAAQLGLSLP